MKNIFTLKIGNISQNIKSIMKRTILLLAIAGGFTNLTYGVSVHDTVGTFMNEFGFNLGGYHKFYVCLVPTDADDNQAIDALFYAAEDTITDYPDFSLCVRFANGKIDARNGGSYTADQSVTYEFNKKYHVWIETAVYDKTYNVFVQAAGSTDVIQLASEYAYRNAVPNTLYVWGTVHNGSGDSSPLLPSCLSVVSKIGDVPACAASDSTDATLKSIDISKGFINETFNPEVLSYTATVPYGTSSVEVSATPSEDGATVTGTGTIDVSSGSGTATIVTTALNGIDQETYTVIISQTPPLSIVEGQDYYIQHEASGFVMSGNDIIEYNRNILGAATADSADQVFQIVESHVPGEYLIKNSETGYLAVPDSLEWNLIFQADTSTTSDSSRFTFFEFESGRFYMQSVVKEAGDYIGTDEPSYGSRIYNNKQGYTNPNAVWVFVKAEDMVFKSGDATLSALTVDVGTLDPVFDAATKTYKLEVPAGTTSVTVTATATDAVNATVVGDGAIAVSSDSVRATIVVTAENGVDNTYVIDILTPGNDDALLSGITVSAGTLDPVFSSSVTTYSVNAPVGTTSVTVTATPNDANATVSGDGVIDVSSGSGTATIVVKSENQFVSKTYTVNIDVEISSISTIPAEAIAVYPNPFKSDFKVSLEGIFEYKLFNMNGAILKQDVAKDVVKFGEDLDQGVYYLQLMQDTKSRTIKLIKL